jgi:hypothetical protein
MLLKKFVLGLSVVAATVSMVVMPAAGYGYCHSSKYANKKSVPYKPRELQRSEEWKARGLTSAPAYISFENKHPVLQVAVLNRSSQISKKLLKETLHVVTKQVKNDFAPYYGIEVEYTVFKDQAEVDWTKYIPLVIPDLLVNPSPGDISFHDLQDSTGLNGTPISYWVTNPPPIPEGTPYIIVPIGNGSSGYGVEWVFLSYPNDPSLPPSFARIFSQAVSHESLETIVNGAVDNYVFFTVSYIPPDFYLFFKEVCDPVQFTPGYEVGCLNVADFVLPSYWDDLYATGPYDFLDTVLSPFLPNRGLQFFYELINCGAEAFVVLSPYVDPTAYDLIDEGPLTSCANCTPCPCRLP